MKPVELIIVGAGCRGAAYADYVLYNKDKAKIVGVAEPREFQRRSIADKHGVSDENVYVDWRQLASRERFADAVVIATQDQMHLEPVVEFAKKGYHILLEKPMAPTADECRKIVAAVMDADVIFGVCHVLRYTPYTNKLKEILDSGVIGEIINIQHTEPVAYWHQAHSFVRGNWRNSTESSFMLLAKSCHDLDFIRYLNNTKCKSVSSFGSLKHFRSENKPAGAGQRCVNCSIESKCPYSAKKLYIGEAKKGNFDWPIDVLTDDLSVDGITEAVASGPYGKCVYDCNNDVVDNQVVNMQFENGSTASFTMVGFGYGGDRRTRIYGTKGEVFGDGSKIEVYNFLDDSKQQYDTNISDGTIRTGHGGGDHGIMEAFVEAVSKNDQSIIKSGPLETLETHLMVFEAENSRLNKKVVDVNLDSEKANMVHGVSL